MSYTLRLRISTLTLNKIFMIVRVVTLKEGDITTVLVGQNMRGDTVEEPAIMGND